MGVPATQVEPTLEEAADVTDAQAEEDFSGGYIEAMPEDEPTETAPPAAQAEPEPTPAPTVPEPVQPEFVQLTKAQVEQLTAGVGKVATIEAALAKLNDTAFGKIGGVERTLKELQAAAQQGRSADVSEEDFQELRDEFPDVVKHLVAGMKRASAKSKGNAPAFDPTVIDSLVNDRVSTKLVEYERGQHVRTVVKAVPDFDTIKADPEFHAWVLALPPERSALVQDTWDPDVIIPACQEFKNRHATPPAPKKPAAPKRSPFADAVVPRGVGGNSPATPTEDDYEAGFKAEAAKFR